MVKEDMAEFEVTEEDTGDIGITGDGKSAVATPDGKSRKKKKKKMLNTRGVCCVYVVSGKRVAQVCHSCFIIFCTQKINCMHNKASVIGLRIHLFISVNISIAKSNIYIRYSIVFITNEHPIKKIAFCYNNSLAQDYKEKEKIGSKQISDSAFAAHLRFCQKNRRL